MVLCRNRSGRGQKVLVCFALVFICSSPVSCNNKEIAVPRTFPENGFLHRNKHISLSLASRFLHRLKNNIKRMHGKQVQVHNKICIYIYIYIYILYNNIKMCNILIVLFFFLTQLRNGSII